MCVYMKVSAEQGPLTVLCLPFDLSGNEQLERLPRALVVSAFTSCALEVQS